MAKNNKHFYIAKGKNDGHPWLFYGSSKPYFKDTGDLLWNYHDCKIIGLFDKNPIAESLEDNTVVKLYIRKETIKTNKNE